jgi:hypothetical protein
MRAWMKSLLSLGLVTLTGYLLDRVLRYEGVPGRDLFIFSDFLVGVVAAILVYVMAEFDDRKQKAIAERLKVIADMNHHIRNALQVISYQSSFREDKKEIDAINDAVNRISWSLREVLPRLPPEF